MGRFKIVSAGWNCADWLEQTLRSVERQSIDEWDVWVTYDPSDDDGDERIAKWCDVRDGRWNYTINQDRRFATRNHYESIVKLDPADDDVIVFLDLDGDRLAHSDVLARLRAAYDAGALVTYGQYRPIPDEGTCTPASPYPAAVVAGNSYRAHHLNRGDTHFNHPRTMAGRVFRAIPEAMFRWPVSGRTRLPTGKTFTYRAGDWYEGSTDYLFMVSALEVAGGRYKCFEEVLLLYNHANPHADNKTHPHEAEACLRNFFARKPLQPLAPTPPPDPFLPPEQRRVILREYGRAYGLKVFVETGTSNGDTPAALIDDFDLLFTIEVGAAVWRAASRRFAAWPTVSCLHGDSAVILPRVLYDIGATPALLWLDGHFSGGDRGSKDTPIIEELEAIFATGARHVILIDDARLFGGMSHYGEHDWPHIDEVMILAERHGYRFEVADDIVRLTPR